MDKPDCQIRHTIKVINFRTPKILLSKRKTRTNLAYNSEMLPKGTYGIVISADPNQTAPTIEAV